MSELQTLIAKANPTGTGVLELSGQDMIRTIHTGDPMPKIEEAKDEPTADSGGNIDPKSKKISWWKKMNDEKLSDRLNSCIDAKTQTHAVWEYAIEMGAKFAVSAFKASVWSAAITAILLALINSSNFGVLLELIKNAGVVP